MCKHGKRVIIWLWLGPSRVGSTKTLILRKLLSLITGRQYSNLRPRTLSLDTENFPKYFLFSLSYKKTPTIGLLASCYPLSHLTMTIYVVVNSFLLPLFILAKLHLTKFHSLFFLFWFVLSFAFFWRLFLIFRSNLHLIVIISIRWGVLHSRMQLRSLERVVRFLWQSH